jgi:hypothetical protein
MINSSVSVDDMEAILYILPIFYFTHTAARHWREEKELTRNENKELQETEFLNS